MQSLEMDKLKILIAKEKPSAQVVYQIPFNSQHLAYLDREGGSFPSVGHFSGKVPERSISKRWKKCA